MQACVRTDGCIRLHLTAAGLRRDRGRRLSGDPDQFLAQMRAAAFAPSTTLRATADRAGQKIALDIFSRRWVHLVFDSLLRTAML